MKEKNITFDYTNIPDSFYDDIAKRKKGMRSFWHYHKFNRIIDVIKTPSNSILDIGCFAGTFLGMINSNKVHNQFGIDILEEKISYANQKYGTSFRKFYHYNDFTIDFIHHDTKFDYITIIEVIEHLTHDEIKSILEFASRNLKTNGKLILTTPNYLSIWPIQEIILNTLSKVKYEDQHITRFNYFNFNKKIKEIYNEFNNHFTIDFKTTTHFISPFISIFSFNIAKKISTAIKHRKWKHPFGSLLLIQMTKK